MSDNYKKFRVKDFKQPKADRATQRPQFHIEKEQPRRWKFSHRARK